MAFFHNSAIIGASGQAGYQVERSLRFNSVDSTYLERTPASAGNRKTWTYSCWLKLASLTQGERNILFGPAGGEFGGVTIYQDGGLRFAHAWDPAGTDYIRETVALFRDPAAWYHVVWWCDTTQSGTRWRIYVNGVEQALQTPGGNNGEPAQNTDLPINSTNAHYLGGNFAYGHFSGYLTEIHFIDGQALTPSSFGEYDTITGVWKPKRYSGSGYGTNGFFLKFADNSGTTAATLGKDSSGNGNNWTPNNFSVTAGAGNDSMIDSCTSYADGGNGRGNYATLNPLDSLGGDFFNGNLEFAGTFASVQSQNGHGCRSTLKVLPTGKWYVEAANITYSGSGNSCLLGFTSSTQAITATAFSGTLTPFIGVDASVFSNRITLSWVGVSGGTANSTQLFATYASGDVVSFAIDFDAGKFWVAKNNTWYNSGNPAAGTNATSTFTVGSVDWAFWGEYTASSDNSNRSSVVANFGQRAFAYTPPSGFKALNTANLPEPSIKKPSSYMDVSLYTGNGGSAVTTVTNSGFQPGLVWLKARSSAYDHKLVDAVRGASGGIYYDLQSNSTGAESLPSAGITSLTSTGFTISAATNNGYNGNGTTFVAWQWAESATSGFDIVTYTGTGSATTIAHNLGVAPAMMIVKKRNTATGSTWVVYHKSLTTPSTDYLRLELTNASATAASVFGAVPTSSVFTVGTDAATNGNADTFVAYLWSEVAGFSKFGSYTGNGSADGPFVFCGFRPRWVMIKASSFSGESWYIFDTARNTYNVIGVGLVPNLDIAEFSATLLDVVSNGFKIRAVNTLHNTNGATYIFAAYAESPFKFALAR